MTQNTMQAIRFHDYGGPEQLVLESVPRPEPQAQTVLVRVYAAGVNPWDWKLRSGEYKQFMPLQFPFMPGIELAGLVEDVSAGVDSFQKGQAVYGTPQGGAYAEYAIVPVNALAPKPASLTFDQAAGVPIGALTAWRSLFDTADLQPGQRVLVQGGAGGVGSFVVQLARWKGAHVTATTSAQNLDFVRSLGAETVIDYQTTRFETTVHDVDIVIDTVGGDVQARSLAVLRRGGILVAVAGRPPEEAAKERGVRAVSVGMRDPNSTGAMLRQIGDLIQEGQLKAYVSKVFPLAAAGQAQALSQQGHGRGRIVLHIAG